MISSLLVRRIALANDARLLALFLSWLMLVAALPTGSVSQAASTANDKTDLSSSSAQPRAQASTTAGASQASTPDESTQARIAAAYGNLSLRFEANQGQCDRSVQFLARGTGYGLFLSAAEAVLMLTKPAPRKDRAVISKSASALEQAKMRRAEREDREAEATRRTQDRKAAAPESAVLHMKLEGANAEAQAQALEELPGKTNYFIGNDPMKWQTEIPSYARVMYREVYPGVDLVYYGQQQQLEYDFRVAPGVDPGNIKLAFEGAQSIEVDAQGDLVLHTKGGDVRQHKPVVYQEVDGVKREIASRYVLTEQQRVSFQIETYDTNQPLVIDPVLLYSTYLGGLNSDEGRSIAVDAAGNAYVTGRAILFDYPVVDPEQSNIFISKLNPAGSALVYSTYLGGTGDENALGIAVDSQGSAYVTGYTYAPDFPLMNPLQAALGGEDDPFVTKLSPAGSALVYSTYLGGSSYEAGNGIAVDATGSAYVTGFTYSHDFPVVNPFQSTKAGHQAFKSTDSGGNWGASDTGLNAFRANDLVINPSNPATLYAATEQGVFKSTDSGVTWNAVNAGLQNTGDALKLAVNPSYPSTVFVGTESGLFKSTNGGNRWFPSLPGTGYQHYVKGIAIDPVHPNTIYTSLSGILYKSTDGGAHWKHKPIIGEYGYEVGVTVLAINPLNSSMVYAGTYQDGVLNSIDGGDHWRRGRRAIAGQPTPEIIIIGFDITALVINPLNPSVIYASTSYSGLLKSTDGGIHWRRFYISEFFFNGISTLAIDPAHPSVIYAGFYGGGIFKTTDSGTNWNAVNTGLTNRIVGGIAIDPTATSKVYAVTDSLADAFVTKLNPSGSARLYSTYLGGDEDDWGSGIALNNDGNAYLTGRTLSSNFPVENPLQASSNSFFGHDAFVTKLDASGSSLAYSTYLGSSDYDEGTGIAVDTDGNAYVTGITEQFFSSSFKTKLFPVTPGAFQTESKGYVNAFVTKINTAGSSLVYSTFLGGSYSQEAYAIAVSSSGQAFVTGRTYSDDFPLANAIQSTNMGVDVFVTRLNAAGSSLVFSTYLGGPVNYSFEEGKGIAVDSANSVYVVGTTDAVNFPVTPNAFQRYNAGGFNDAFITKIGAPPASIQISGKVLLNGSGLGGVTVTLKNKAGSVLQTTTTHNDGSYSFNAPGGGDYTVTPSKPGYTFTPPSRSYSKVGTDLPMQNFEAMLSTFRLQVGMVDIFGNGVRNVKIVLSGARSATCTTDFNGNCLFPDIPSFGHYTVTPSKAGASFSPATRTFNNPVGEQFATFKAAFSISGQITGFNGIGIGGVTLELDGDRRTFTTTDNHGNYQFNGLPAGGHYTVTPANGGMTFNPAFAEFSYLDAPMTANLQALVSITGKVRLAGTTLGISGVTMKLTGSRNSTTTTTADGIYTFANLLAGGNYTVKPMKSGFTFDPPSRTFTDLRVGQTLRTASFDHTP